MQWPSWEDDWVAFADWLDLLFGLLGLLLAGLLIIWWRQQTRQWFRIATGTALAALLLCIASFYLFAAPPYYAGCPQGCLGWRGYPRAFATITLTGVSGVAPVDFVLNWLILWLLWLVASVVWRLLAVGFGWWERSWRARLLFVLLVVVLPWALLPRFIEPPQPRTSGEDLRLATNARRAAEFTYRITGFWVQRLALEDVRYLVSDAELESEPSNVAGSQVCLRGYTYFYLPWLHYRIDLDASGVTALSLTPLPLTTPCWSRE
jgi:hypothetical protein